MNNKHLLVVLGVFTGVLVGSFSGNSHVDAASWHKGAPAALRGEWRSSYYHSKDFSNYAYTRTYFYIGKTRTDGVNNFYSKQKKLVSGGSGWGINNKLHYKKLSRTKYEIVDYFGKSKDYHTITFHGHKVTISRVGTSALFTRIKR